MNSSQKYCFECGAKVIKNRLTFRNILEDINERFFNLDNKLLKTFSHLFTKPEVVIKGYIDGTRKRYIDIIQYFAISLTLVGLQVFLMNTVFQDALNFDESFVKSMGNLPNSKDNPFKDIRFRDFNNYQSLIYTLTIPISALATWLAYYIVGLRQYNFTEHIVINLYYSAQVIIITAVLSILFLCFGLNYLVISSFITVLTIIYLFYILKRVFNTKFWDSVLNFILVMVIYGAIFSAFIFFGILIALIANLTN